MKKLLIIAGGTGGHIFPALAVAKAYQEKGKGEVYWLGAKGKLEEKIIEGKFPIDYLPISGMRGKNFFTKLKMPFQLIKSIFQAIRIIKKINPDVVLAMGGYVSAPGSIAAKLLRKPLIIHEQNSIAGLTNRYLAKIADTVLEAFPHTLKQAKTVGNPVRQEIIHIPDPKTRLTPRTHTVHLLILGGSQGAHFINEKMPKILKQFPTGCRPIVWHQAGMTDRRQVLEDYRACLLDARVDDFIQNMFEAYEWADVVIARSGALTIAELAAAGLASILIPFPEAVDNHQYTNAKYLAEGGAAIILEQKNFDDQKLIDLLNSFLKDRIKIIPMSENARALAKPKATEEIAGMLYTYST